MHLNRASPLRVASQRPIVTSRLAHLRARDRRYGIDNDGDGLTDFPADCNDPLAARETSVIDPDFDLIADDFDNCPTAFNPFQDIPGGAVGCRAR